MVAQSLAKLIDEAIVPAVILIAAKVLGVLLAAYFLKLNYQVTISLLPKVSFASVQDYILTENYSNLTMYVAAAVGSLLILLKAHFLHETHITPKLQQKLASFSLEKLILPSYHLYHQAAIWLLFLWLTTGFLLVSSALKITYLPISIIALIVTINFSWILAHDIQKELQI